MDERKTRVYKAIGQWESMIRRFYPDEAFEALRRAFVHRSSDVVWHSKMDILMIALNWGALDNRQALLDSQASRDAGWDESYYQALIDTLDERDWAFVSAVWAQMASCQREVLHCYEKRTGIRPDHPPLLPVQTPFGIRTGGIFPLFFISDASGNNEPEAITLADAARRVMV